MLAFARASIPIRNRILAALPHDQYRRLFGNLVRVDLLHGETICHPGEPVQHAYFIGDGIVSLVNDTADGQAVEVGMIGAEGLVGILDVLGVGTAHHQTVVRVGGTAMQIPASMLREEVDCHAPLRELLFRFQQALVFQISQLAVCNRFHSTEQRLARWLLACSDRVRSPALHLTHEELGRMIGAQRTRVTMAAGDLKKEKLINSSRGQVTIIERKGLEAHACECYGLMRETLERCFDRKRA